MSSACSLFFARGTSDICLRASMANRHGLIAGATGTGKTVTVRVLSELLSAEGIPVFLADVKGDLSGIVAPGGDNPKVVQRVADLALPDFGWQGYPVTFWDVFGQQGHPLRATVAEMGPLLLSRLLNLNDTQAGVLQLTFKVADDHGLLLLDLKDLRAMLQYVAENAATFQTTYGNVSAASVGAIQRGLLTLESQGGELFFGEPALDLADLLQTDAQGRGMVNILTADKLLQNPRVYATMLLWLLSELFERLPEVGDLDKPKLVFFFDEAHLLFDDAPKALVDKIEQVVRLIRSKGVGVFFATQNPLDIPDSVSSQLGNRVVHSLRAFSVKEQKVVRAVAETFRASPDVDAAQALLELSVGEALVSTLDEKGRPTPVQRAWVYPPHSRMTPLTPQERAQVIASSLVAGHYEKVLDRESAYERLTAAVAAGQAQANSGGGLLDGLGSIFGGGSGAANTTASGPVLGQRPAKRQPQTMTEKIVGDVARSVARTMGTQIGRSIIRGVLGGLLGGRG